MGKIHPDQLVSALSKHLKTHSAPVLRFTFKRGALWQPEHAKAHSRKAKAALKQQIKTQAVAQGQEQVWPLLARFKSNDVKEKGKEQKEKQQTTKLKLNCESRPGKGEVLLQSLMSVFRVNFFNKKGEGEHGEQLKSATKADPNSKSSLRRKQKSQRNQQRRSKRKQIKRQKNRTLRLKGGKSK